MRDPSFLARFAWLSIATAILIIGFKTMAYLVTGSVGLLSDALEPIVNLVGALMALAMVAITAWLVPPGIFLDTKTAEMLISASTERRAS